MQKKELSLQEEQNIVELFLREESPEAIAKKLKLQPAQIADLLKSDDQRSLVMKRFFNVDLARENIRLRKAREAFIDYFADSVEALSKKPPKDPLEKAKAVKELTPAFQSIDSAYRQNAGLNDNNKETENNQRQINIQLNQVIAEKNGLTSSTTSDS